MHHWSKEAIESIKINFPIGNIDKVVKETGRSKEAVRIKANRLGVYLKPMISVWFEKIPLEKRIYLSGHFDGEGCVLFRKKYARLTRTPALIVQICNIETLALYNKYFNGKISKAHSSTNKQMYKWTCVKYEDVYNFILAVSPFSIEKNKQLLLVKDFVEDVLKNGKGLHFSEDFRSKAIELHERCTALKKL